MIKAVILDVDGVVKGSKKGINYPIPHKEVLNALIEVSKKGIPVVLCTSNYYGSIKNIIKLADLRNPHIADMGALIIDTLSNVVYEKQVIEKNLVNKILEKLLSLGVYVEVYSDLNYFIQKSYVSDFTQKRIAVYQEEPIIADSLLG